MLSAEPPPLSTSNQHQDRLSVQPCSSRLGYLLNSLLHSGLSGEPFTSGQIVCWTVPHQARLSVELHSRSACLLNRPHSARLSVDPPPPSTPVSFWLGCLLMLSRPPSVQVVCWTVPQQAKLSVEPSPVKPGCLLNCTPSDQVVGRTVPIRPDWLLNRPIKPNCISKSSLSVESAPPGRLSVETPQQSEPLVRVVCWTVHPQARLPVEPSPSRQCCSPASHAQGAPVLKGVIGCLLRPTTLTVRGVGTIPTSPDITTKICVEPLPPPPTPRPHPMVSFSVSFSLHPVLSLGYLKLSDSMTPRFFFSFFSSVGSRNFPVWSMSSKLHMNSDMQVLLYKETL